LSKEHINHSNIAQFAEERVNLPKLKADAYRKQVRNLRDKLETYIGEHPDFSLKKMMLSGSLAKGTALRSLNDIDVACYIGGADAPNDIVELMKYLTERLREAFPNFDPQQIQPQTYSVTIFFKGSGLDVDIVPILYDGDPSWFGNLVSQDDGTFLKTNIPFHLEFTRKRKEVQKIHFAQVVRLVKFWANKMKQEQEGFRFKSFMIEMILAHLCDQGKDFSDYPEALQHFFTFVAQTDMRESIIFTDYYKQSSVGAFTEPIKIIDPVNAENNAGKLYTDQQADLIVDAALEAGDAIDSASAALTKQETVRYWQKIFGTTFH